MWALEPKAISAEEKAITVAKLKYQTNDWNSTLFHFFKQDIDNYLLLYRVGYGNIIFF